MKKTVWTFGLISGGVISVLMLATLPFEGAFGYDRGLIIGYTTMVAAFLLIYFGVRSYRDNIGGGSIGFGRALVIGSLIAVISSLCYVATWEVVYFRFRPDFLEKFQAYEINKVKASGASQAAIDQAVADQKRMAEMYKNPVFNAAFTLIEPLPVGLVIALVSAATLRRRRSSPSGQPDAVATG